MSHTIKDRRSVILGPDGNPARGTVHVHGASLDPISVVGPSLDPSSMYGSFQGADFSRDRGFVYLPTLDTKKEVDAWTHTELQTRARVIRNSAGGLIQRGIKGIGRMVCGTGLMPYPMPVKVKGREAKLREWSRKVRSLYAQRCGSPNTFHLGRRYTSGSAQRATVSNKIVDGDNAWVLARDEATNRLRVAIYEANQIGNGSSKTGTDWHHGVKCNRHNAAEAYRILGRDRNDRETWVDVPAQNVLFNAEFERFNQVRGLTRFYPVLNKILDRGEIMAAMTKGIKIASHIAYVIEESQTQHGQFQGTPGAPGSMAPRPTKFIQTNDGRTLTLEQFLQGGGEAWDLPKGKTFKMVQANNPHPNVQAHLQELVRDVALALGYYPEILWNIIELGGANMRFVQADTQSQLEVEQEELVDQAIGPHYIAWLRDMIEAGEVEDVEGWELHTWLLPGRLTVDFGRDGKLHIEQYKRGHITMRSLYGYRGEEWQLEVDQYLDERQYIKEGIESRGLTWDEAYPELKQGGVMPGNESSALPAEKKKGS
jgi:capsid protein